MYLYNVMLFRIPIPRTGRTYNNNSTYAFNKYRSVLASLTFVYATMSLLYKIAITSY